MLKIALTASIFEGYESSLIGFMALEIGREFFPKSGDKTALMLSFSVFASSFLARPIGSVLFGLWANRRGVGLALRGSLILVAIPAALVAFLPTYSTAGYLATGLLIGLRILQGLAEGGDAPLCAYYVALNTPAGYRGLYCGIAASSGFIGWLCASFVVFILPYCASLVSGFFPSSAHAGPMIESWRWPFLLCVPLSLWVFSIRRSSLSIEPSKEPARQRDWRTLPITPLLQVVALVSFTTVQLFALFIWLPSYLHTYVGVSRADAHVTNVIALIVFSLVMVGAGYATRWTSASKFVLIGIASLTLLSYPLFMMLQGGGLIALLLVQLAFALMAGCLFGAIFIVLPDLLKDNWQSMGMTVAYTLPVVIFGGTAPLVCGYLIESTHLLTVPALYIVAMGIIALPVAYRLAFPESCPSMGEFDYRRKLSLIKQEES
jgi:MHS family proline/betaine transporter-like MFS transporter